MAETWDLVSSTAKAETPLITISYGKFHMTGMAGAWDLVPATTKNEIQLIKIPSAKFHIK